MKKKVIVLGAGLVGKVMALDLAKNAVVTSADINETALEELRKQGIQTRLTDFSNPLQISEAIRPFDLVIGAVPGFLGYQTMKTVIESGKNMVDISFFPEDPFPLDVLAKKMNVTIIMDCGVAPGMSNVILGYHNESMRVTEYECLVGGLPVKREWPFQYKAVFSPIDVIEEYVRPARFVQNGKMVTREALSDSELVHFDKVGTLESWNSDGLRTLIKTMPHIPNMIEKTLRYPGAVEYLRVLREAGFFSKEPVSLNGINVRPLDVTAKLLFPQWKLEKGEEEFTVMRIRVKGEQDGRHKTFEYNLHDTTEKLTGTLSMARTTGYTCTAAAELVLNGSYEYKGISPPEFLGRNATHFEFIMNYLNNRNVVYKVSETQA